MSKETKTGLELLRVPFEAHQISKLPKPTRAQTDEVKANFQAGMRCDLCGGWHHPKVVHLDYVGHAALTDRLLNCDPNWNWEPASANGLPTIDNNGGMWIKLTVCGVSRLGYGHSDGKTGGDAIKETIGDALRNAAMRFGAALDLWHKGDLHKDESEEPKKQIENKAPIAPPTASGDYVIQGKGSLTGKALKDVSLNMIQGNVKYWQDRSTKENKPLTGIIKTDVDTCIAYLKAQE